jgi:hypothetical protein
LSASTRVVEVSMRSRKLLLVATVLAASGCYRYLPAPASAVAPGTPVRMRITAQQAEALRAQRLSDNRLLNGTVVEKTEQGFMVETEVGRNDPTRGTRAVTQLLSIPESGVLEIEQRTLDRGRTGMAMVAGGVVLGVVVALQSRGGQGGTDTPGPGTQEARRVPLLKLALPLGGR